MDVTTCLQTVVNTGAAYQSNPSDINHIHLQQGLDSLISLTNRSSSLAHTNVKDVLLTECLSYLVDILDDPHTKSSLAQKIMNQLENFCNSEHLKKVLHSTFCLTASLTKFLKSQTVSAGDPSVVLCLNLLLKSLYGCKVAVQESYIEDLIHILIKHIKEREDELTLPCVGVLANLCRNNFLVQTQVKNQPDLRPFYKKLSIYTSNADNRLVMYSLSVLTSLRFNEDAGDILMFSTNNLHQLFRILFKSLVQGDPRRCTVDVFVDLLKCERFQKALSTYQHLESCLSAILPLLYQVKLRSDSSMLELMNALGTVSTIRGVLCRCFLEASPSADMVEDRQNTSSISVSEPFAAVVHWAGQSLEQSEVSLVALDLLREFYEEVLDQGLVRSAASRTEQVYQLLSAILSSPDTLDNNSKHCMRLSKCLRLALVMATDETLQPQLGQVINAQQCVRLIEHQLQHSHLVLSSAADKEDSWTDNGVAVLLLTLDLMTYLLQHSPNMEVHLCNILQDQRLAPILSYGIMSGHREHIQIVLQVISRGSRLPNFPLVLVGDNMAAHHGQLLIEGKYAEPPENEPNRRPLTEQQIPIRRTTMPTAVSEQTIESITEKLKNGLDLGTRVSDVISVYENRLQSLKTKEDHQQDMLDAKGLALSQADRLIAQYRCRLARSETEAQRLRSLLAEDYREQLNDMMLERERLTNDLEQAAQDNARLEAVAGEHRELKESFVEHGLKLEASQRSLATLREEYESLSEMYEMVNRHKEKLKAQHDQATRQLLDMEEETKTQARLLKEQETSIQDLTKDGHQHDREIRKMTKERNDLEKGIDIMRETLAKAEQAKKDLTHHVKVLESDHKEKISQIQQQKADIDKYTQLADLIHNITGKNSAGSAPS